MMVHSFIGRSPLTDHTNPGMLIRPFQCRLIYRKSLISTMSLVAETRYTAIVPSREMAKLLIKFDLKFVNCFGAVPSIGWVQTLKLRETEARYATDRPSGIHPNEIG